MVARRGFIAGSLAAGAAGLHTVPFAMQGAEIQSDASEKIAALEQGEARLGVCLLDTATGEITGNRMHERFAMCSTFKLALAAACMREAEAGRLNMDQVIAYTQEDITSHSPVTMKHLDKGGMRAIDLAEATVKTSDNAAANLLLRLIGGPDRLTSLLRRMGDDVTRVDRYEPEMNFVLSADMRDTTSPAAIAQLVRDLTLGKLLSEANRAMILQWMIDTRTGLRRIRAGLPKDWVSGDKTGTGLGPGTTNKYNDVAIAFPPDRAPIMVSVYFDSAVPSDRIEPHHQAVLAEVGRIAAEWALR